MSETKTSDVDEQEKRFKLYWEGKAKADIHLSQECEKEISFGRTPAFEWNRNSDKKLFRDLATVLEVKEGRGVVLDIGCGPLARAEVQFSLMSIRTIGLDISRTIAERAREHIVTEGKQENVDFVVGDAESLPFRQSAFSGVISLGMISHMPTTKCAGNAIREMARVTSNKGIVFVNWLQNLFSAYGIWESFLLKIADIMGVNRAQMLQFRGLGEVRSLFRQAGLSIKEMRHVSTITLPIPAFLPSLPRRLAVRTQYVLDEAYVFKSISRTYDIVATH